MGKVWSWNLWGRTPATRWLHSTVRWNVSNRDPYWNVCRICWNISRVTSNMLTNYTWYIVPSRKSFVFAKVGLLTSCMINSYNSIALAIMKSIIDNQVKFSTYFYKTNSFILYYYFSFFVLLTCIFFYS